MLIRQARDFVVQQWSQSERSTADARTARAHTAAHAAALPGVLY